MLRRLKLRHASAGWRSCLGSSGEAVGRQRRYLSARATARFTRRDPGLRRDDDPESGFTLVELMVVIVIIGLLATIVIINVLPSQDRAMTQKARSDVALLEQALEMYRLDNMSYPRGEQGLQALVSAPAGLAQAGRYRQGGYIKKLPEDPWGAPYKYENPGTHGGPFDIYSLGADGQPGGEGENADIGSWE